MATSPNMTQINLINDYVANFGNPALNETDRDQNIRNFEDAVNRLETPMTADEKIKIIEHFQKMQQHINTLADSADKDGYLNKLANIKTAISAKSANPDDVVLEEIAPGHTAAFNANDEFVTTEDTKKVVFETDSKDFPYKDLFAHGPDGQPLPIAQILVILWNHHQFQEFKHYGWRMAEVGRRIYDVGAQEREILRLQKIPKMADGSTRPDVQDQIQQCRARIAQNRDGYNGKAIKKEIDNLEKRLEIGVIFDRSPGADPSAPIKITDATNPLAQAEKAKIDARLAVLRQDLAKQHGDNLWDAMRDARKNKTFARDIDLGRRERKALLTYIKDGITNNPAAQKYFTPKVLQDQGNSGARATARNTAAAIHPAAGPTLASTITPPTTSRMSAFMSTAYARFGGGSGTMPAHARAGTPGSGASTRTSYSMFRKRGAGLPTRAPIAADVEAPIPTRRMGMGGDSG